MLISGRQLNYYPCPPHPSPGLAESRSRREMPTLPESGLLAPVVCFKPRDAARSVRTISQKDCDELDALRVEFRKIEDKLQEKERWIKEALRSGAQVEPGFYNPEIMEIEAGGYSVPP